MIRNLWWTALGLLAFAGCGSNPESTDISASPAPAGAGASDAGAVTSEVKLSEEDIAQIKKLPESEQAAALEQRVCPISNEPLGSMGTPIKVSTEGATAYLCCEGCKEDFEKDPKAAVAKLTKK